MRHSRQSWPITIGRCDPYLAYHINRLRRGREFYVKEVAGFVEDMKDFKCACEANLGWVGGGCPRVGGMWGCEGVLPGEWGLYVWCSEGRGTVNQGGGISFGRARLI